MGEIDNYSEEALKRSGKNIKNYKKEESHGVIEIKYDLVDRAKGAAIGTAVTCTTGWCGKFGLVLASTVVPISTPVVASILIGTTLGSPIVGATAGAIIGSSTTKSHFFDSSTGALLGNNQNQAFEELYNRGCQLFQEGYYTEATKYFRNAYLGCSAGYQNEQLFKKNRDKAQAEVDALNLNSEGDNLFRQGKYSEAESKYKEAYDKSQVRNEYNKYSANRDKAQAEVDAINLNSEGDNLFRQGKYSEAENKYKEACDKSQVSSEYNKYSANRTKAQTIINKLFILDTLWNKAWEAENDIENDRSEEAKEIFQRVLCESKDNLKKFPDNFRFKQYETLVSLKIEGNELFNEGLVFHQNGIDLLKVAQKLKQQKKYKSANIKLKNAKCKFSAAQEKFKIGSEHDQRFLSCIEFVKMQLNEVAQLMANTELPTLYQEFNDLNINIRNNLDTNAYESNIIMVTGEQHSYYEQI